MTGQFSIVIPAFNEQEIIGSALAELKELVRRHDLEADIIVVDDGSSDDTSNIALREGVRVLRHHSNRGYGAALKTGILAAKYEHVAIADADGTYPFQYLPEMLEELQNSDMVVGARTGENVHIPWVRLPAKWVLNKLANYVSGARIPDINSGLRVFRRPTVLQYFPILPDQFSWTTTITIAMLCDRYAVKFVPIDYRPRTGRSKIVPWDAGAFTILILRMAVLFRPLRVLLPLVGICFGYGVVKMIVDLVIMKDPNISASAILMFISSLIILFMGMIADAIVIRLSRFSATRLPSARPDESEELDPGVDIDVASSRPERPS